MYLLSWLLTLFSKNIPLEVAARIWMGTSSSAKHFSFARALEFSSISVSTCECACAFSLCSLLVFCLIVVSQEAG